MTKQPLPRIRAGFDREAPEIVTVVSASSGYAVLEFEYDEDDAITGFYRIPVVAWGISSTGSALPITPYAEQTTIDQAVVGPCGTVVCYDGTWASVDEWYERMAPLEEEFRKKRTAGWKKPQGSAGG